MSSETNTDTDFPAEHVETVRNFQTSLAELETVLKNLLDVPLSVVHESKATTPLEKAKLDIISAFALNSLTWMWLRTQGTNPKETEVSTNSVWNFEKQSNIRTSVVGESQLFGSSTYWRIFQVVVKYSF